MYAQPVLFDKIQPCKHILKILDLGPGMVVVSTIVVLAAELAWLDFPDPEIPKATFSPVHDEVHAVVVGNASLEPLPLPVLPAKTPNRIAAIPIVLEVHYASHQFLEQLLELL